MNWSERQLNIFKGKRQKGERPPAPDEYALHYVIADVLKRWCNPSWRYTHIPLGEYRRPITAARLKRMGVTAGWPDFVFFHFRGKVCFLELKREGSRATQAQEELALFLMRAGCGYLLTDNFDDALCWLRDTGIVPARIASYGANAEKDTSWPPTQESAIE